MSRSYPSARDEYQKCFRFLNEYEDGGEQPYMERIQEIANRERSVIEIRLDDIVDFTNGNDMAFINNIKKNTRRYIIHFQKAIDELLPEPTNDNFYQDVYDILKAQQESRRALEEQVAGENAGGPLPENENAANTSVPPELYRRYEISMILEANEESKKLREVRSQNVGNLVKVKGMVTRCTEVKPQLKVCVYTCDECGCTMFDPVQGESYMPIDVCQSLRCSQNRTTGKVHMQNRGSRFSKFQEVRLQELPDQVPVGHIPRCMTIRCSGEQTRKCSPGDIVTISGIYLMDRKVSYAGTRARVLVTTYIDATDVKKDKQGYDEAAKKVGAHRRVQEVARGVSPYHQLASSIAPEIFGHEDVKKALLLQLVGGVTKIQPDGMKIRGDINLLLMGDPGVAKSQLLKYIATVAPRGVYTTGKGSSGVGLTAALIKDSLTGELTLEGGALVMADKGICCIDEFDKMDENDRTSIHEVMEQQTISIAKAGITTTLNARAAVLAAANPLYGRYNKRRTISENIDLPNSLLSRFDLLYLLLDKADADQDRRLSMHVLHVHKYLKNLDPEFEPLLPEVVKQYIAVARSYEPAVPRELSRYIVDQYVNLRAEDNRNMSQNNNSSRGSNDQTAMTARQLLSILRLSQALARIRLADEISEDDVEEAIRLTNSSKSSLFDEGPAGPQEDAMSTIFRVMRDYVEQRGVTQLSFNQAEAMIVNRGYSVEQLNDVLEEYENLNVIRRESEGQSIIFEQ